jgi:threonine synthase
MDLVSTRNDKKTVNFRTAVLDCIPTDGGLYVPAREENLRPWVLYMDESTSFSSIAGTLSSALLKDELSPVVSERIAGKAFANYSPELRQLDDHLFSLELYHGPTGCHKDFGLAWLASALEHILTIEGRTATVLAASAGMTGRSMARAFAGKQRLKMILVYAKGTLAGLNPADLAWNGGNIYPVEIDGDLRAAESLVREVYLDRDLVAAHGLTLANTMNIGRLLPQVFFYMYAFTRLRKKVQGDIFYAVPSGNYGNLVAGLYAWKFSLPVNGFLTDATAALGCDPTGQCVCLDSLVPLAQRGQADPAAPSNLERLEQVFAVNPLMVRGLVFPAVVKPEAVAVHQAELYRKYGVFVDAAAGAAYGSAVVRWDRISSDEGTVVLVSKDHPAYEADRLRAVCGAAPDVSEAVRSARDPVSGFRRIEASKAALVEVLRGFA